MKFSGVAWVGLLQVYDSVVDPAIDEARSPCQMTSTVLQ